VYSHDRECRFAKLVEADLKGILWVDDFLTLALAELTDLLLYMLLVYCFEVLSLDRGEVVKDRATCIHHPFKALNERVPFEAEAKTVCRPVKLRTRLESAS
jgi:hypothetical protein